MNFAFDAGETIARYPAEIYTIMECLRRGGHRVVMLGASVPKGLALDFSHFEFVSCDGWKSKAAFCRDNNICALMDDDTYVIDEIHEVSPSTARLQVMP